MKIDFYHVDAFESANYEPIWRALRQLGVDAQFVAVPGPKNTAAAGWFDFERFQQYCAARQIPFRTEADLSADLGITTQNTTVVYPYRQRVRLMYGPILYPPAWGLQRHSVSPFDAVLVHGQAYTDRFSNWLPADRLPVIGYPRYDDFFARKPSKTELRQRWALTDAKPVLAFLPTWDTNTAFDTFFPELVKLSDRFHILLRPHHCTVRMEPSRINLMRASGLTLLDNAFDLIDILAGADVVVSDVRSGGFFEACMCDVPTVGMVKDESELKTWLAHEQVDRIAKLCRNAALLSAAVDEAIESAPLQAGRQAWADRHVAYRDGSAALKAAEALIQLAEPRRTQVNIPAVPEPSYACKVSVVLPTYNHVEFLPHAVKAIMAQTLTDFELIIVNDGSKDATPEYLATLTDPRIRVINRANGGLPTALNTGFAAARGQYLTWTSSDNFTAPTWLERLAATLDAAPATTGFAVSGFALINERDQLTGIRRGQNLALESLASKNPGIASFMYRSSVAKQVGDYDPTLLGAEDWDMWLRIVEACDPVYVDDVLYYYRQHSNSMTGTMPEKIRNTSTGTLNALRMRHGNGFDLHRFYPRLIHARNRPLALWQAKARLAAMLTWSPFCPPAWTAQLYNEVLTERFAPEVQSNFIMLLCLHGAWDMALNALDNWRAVQPSPQLDSLRELVVKHDARVPQMLPLHLTPPGELAFELGRA